MILLFLVMSVLASSLNEIYSYFRSSRARNLRGFIDNLFRDNGMEIKKIVGGTVTVREVNGDDFYRNTAVVAQTLLTRGDVDDARLKLRTLPAYVKAEDFASSLSEIIRQCVATKQLRGAGNDPLQPITPAMWREALSEMRENSPLRRVVQTALEQAGDDMPGLMKWTQDWFNSAMDRLSGFYKRQVVRNLLAIGLLVSVPLNIDAVRILNSLLENPALREGIAAQAQLTGEQLMQRAEAFATLTAQLEATRQAPAAGDQPPGTTSGGGPISIPFTPDSIPGVYELKQLNLQLGWPDPSEDRPPFGATPWEWFMYTLKKVVGIVITSFAVTQGAPFWFDLLNKVTNLRSSGKPPAVAPTTTTTSAVPVVPATPIDPNAPPSGQGGSGGFNMPEGRTPPWSGSGTSGPMG
jgi:hypothetical protein